MQSVLTVSKVKNARGHITGYRAQFADIASDIQPTKAVAEEQCLGRARQACMFSPAQNEILQFNGIVYSIVCFRTLYGWEYTLTAVHLDGRVEPHTAHSAIGYSENVSNPRNTIISDAHMHAAQWIFSSTANSALAREYVATFLTDTTKLSEFMNWADWQERARIIGAKGYNSQEIHRLACATHTIAEAHAVPEFALTRED